MTLTEIYALDIQVNDRLQVGSSVARVHGVKVHRSCKHNKCDISHKCDIKNTVTIGLEDEFTLTRFSLFLPLTMLTTVTRS